MPSLVRTEDQELGSLPLNQQADHGMQHAVKLPALKSHSPALPSNPVRQSKTKKTKTIGGELSGLQPSYPAFADAEVQHRVSAILSETARCPEDMAFADHHHVSRHHDQISLPLEETAGDKGNARPSHAGSNNQPAIHLQPAARIVPPHSEPAKYLGSSSDDDVQTVSPPLKGEFEKPQALETDQISSLRGIEHHNRLPASLQDWHIHGATHDKQAANARTAAMLPKKTGRSSNARPKKEVRKRKATQIRGGQRQCTNGRHVKKSAKTTKGMNAEAKEAAQNLPDWLTDDTTQTVSNTSLS